MLIKPKFNPVFKNEPGYVVGVKAGADQGKTATVTGLMLDLVNFGGYQFSEVHSVYSLYDCPGYHKYNLAGIRQFILDMLNRPVEHVIILCDEWDLVFPGRMFSDKEQTKILIGLFQVTKLSNWVFGTEHLGGAIVDNIIRKAVQIGIVPTYVPELDEIDLDIYNGVDNVSSEGEHYLYPAHFLFNRYNRWEPVK